MLDDPGTPGELARLVKALDGPKPYSEAAHARIGSKVAATVANPAAPAAVASKASSLKLVTISGAVVTGVGAIAFFMFTRSSPSEPPREARPAPAVVAPATPTAEPVAPSPEVATPAPKPKTQERTPPRASARDDLAVEETLLEQARKAPPPRALALLREHERRFPSGLLTAERLYLSAKAHAESGNQTAARRYATELERRFPASSYVARLRAILGETSTDKSP
jgi:hypothetical protein